MNLLIIFTRNPELGKAKTRLAKTIGDQSALEVYKYLLNHTKNVTQNANCDKAVYYSVKVRDNDIWDSNIYQKHQQHGNDLGERMHNAFEQAFKNGYKKVAIIGSDLFHLTTNHINQAFEQLDTNDAVIGPAEDGGYYLLALKQPHAEVFKNKQWSTDTVFADTIKSLQNKNIAKLEVLNDIDTFDDIKHIPELKKFYN